MGQVRIFLSHSSKDKPLVRKLALGLKALGISPWLDEIEIKPGDSLFAKIGDGLQSSDYLFILVSEHSIKSRWVAEELHSMMAQQLSVGATKVVPLKVDDAMMPWFLAEKKYLDFRGWQREDNYRRSFGDMVASFGWIPSVQCKKTGIEFLKVEDGPFKFGKDNRWDGLPTFWVSRYVLTAAQLVPYLDELESAKGYSFNRSHLVREQVRENKGNWPATHVPVGIGFGFAKWAGFDIPTERQWEKAARGSDGRIYPWGDTWDERLCNTGVGEELATVAVDAFPDGVSPYGCFNMAGNVIEVTSTVVADNENDTHYAGKGGGYRGVAMSVTTFSRVPCSDFGEYPMYGYRFILLEPTSLRFHL